MPVSAAFWMLFFILLIIVFFTLKSTLPPLFAKKNITAPTTEQIEEVPIPAPAVPLAEKPPVDKPASPPPARPQPSPAEPKTPAPSEQKPAVPPAQPPQPPRPVSSLPIEKPIETRDRGIFFMEEKGADLLLTKVNRSLRISSSPLIDCLNALLAGPTAEEQRRGLVSFIPPNTRVISAMVRGDTAYLDFNEEFQYNTFGREGSIAQLRQIVWTATEFPNVLDVQILIEGKRVDFLSEGVMIGSPLKR